MHCATQARWLLQSMTGLRLVFSSIPYDTAVGHPSLSKIEQGYGSSDLHDSNRLLNIAGGSCPRWRRLLEDAHEASQLLY
jgi:hypothetical protein